MPLDYRFIFPLPNGLHARPASHLEALTNRFRSAITLIHEKTHYRANARSVLSMVSADVKFDDPCRIHVDGEDEQPALEAVRSFLELELPHCDQALPEVVSHDGALVFPRSLVAAGPIDYLRGKAVCGGVGWGKAVIFGVREMPTGFEHDKPKDAPYELDRATAAVNAVAEEIAAKIAASNHDQEIEVLKAHSSIVRDVALSEAIGSLISTKRRTAAQAIAAACATFSETLRNSQSSYLRERVLDIEDICIQLLNKVIVTKQPAENGSRKSIRSDEDREGKGSSDSNHNGHIKPAPAEAWICVAEHLTPGQFLAIDRRCLSGLVLGEGGTTSHTVILARSMNIPTLVGISASSSVVAGQEILLDGNLGILVRNASDQVRRYYQMERDRLDRRRQQLEAFRDIGGMTSDRHPVEVGANIASAEEAEIAFVAGAQGIGLFRTEMLFMDRAEAPSEQDQYRIYSTALESAKGRPVIIRLLDIGGDKPADYLKLPSEENPFLGYRGVRLYEQFSELVKTQLRAILRASAALGNAKILVPMVCCMEEVQSIKSMLTTAAAELRDGGVIIEKLPPIGVMLEIPSVAFTMPEFCNELDFFSIGSNDLIQYFFAADRGNEKVSQLYRWSNPAFLRLLQSVIDQAHQNGKWVGLCGEMGDDPAALPLLVGLGLDEISVSAPRVRAVKEALGKLNYSHCRQIVADAMNASTRQALESLLHNASSRAVEATLVGRELIFAADGKTKEEVIKQLADRLYLAGRAVEPRLLEEAIWNREDTYSTGFGHGFALPHCKSNHLAANSIVVARLTEPVEWGSLDAKPVDLVILLAIRDSADARAHMKIFAKLSRLVMRDEFRDRIRGETDPDQLVEFLQQSLGPEAEERA